jgi:hypothetical protein
MSILRNPIILAIIAFGVVFVAMYYWYNHLDTSNKKLNKKKIKKEGINETTVISATIAGLLTWYIASSMFSENLSANVNSNDNSNDNSKTKQESFESVNANIVNFNNTGHANNNPTTVPGDVNLANANATHNMLGGKENTKIPQINGNDPTRSYNLIGSGLSIPRSELKIPNVLIDYK